MQREVKKPACLLLAMCLTLTWLLALLPPLEVAAAVPIPVAHGAILYENNFEGSDPLADFSSNANVSIATVDGNKVLKVDSPTNGGALVYGGDTAWDDYYFSMDLTMLASNLMPAGNENGASAGLVFRYKDSANFYHMRFEIRKSSMANLQFYKWEDGVSSMVTQVGIDLEMDTAYNLAVEVAGSNIRAYIDGGLVMEVKDSSHATGAIGLRAFECRALYDNFLVADLANPRAQIESFENNGIVTSVPVIVAGNTTGAYSAGISIDGGTEIPLDVSSGRFSYSFYPKNGDHTISVTSYSYDKSENDTDSRTLRVNVANKALAANLDKTVGQAVDGPVVVRFSAPVDAATIGGVSLLKDGVAVNASVALDPADFWDTRVLVSPDSPLEPGAAYAVIIDSTVEDYAGNGAGAALSLPFTAARNVADLPALDEGTGQLNVNLNGKWFFRADPYRQGDSHKWAVLEDPAMWDTLNVPGNWDTENDYATYTGIGWYARTVDVPTEYEGYPVWLELTAVYHDCEIFVNGESAGTHDGGYTTFERRIDHLLRYGEENTIAVKVDSTYAVGAWWKWGGMGGDALLKINNPVKMLWQHIVSTPDLNSGTAVMDIEYKLSNLTGESQSYTLLTQVFDKATGALVETVQTPATLTGAENEILSAQIALSADKVKLWNYDDPNLYRVETRLLDGGTTLHVLTDNTGIREIEIDTTRLYINGEAVKLTGANRVGDDRVNGQTEPDYLVMRDIDYMKSMGINCARLSHVAMRQNILDYCDEVGFLLICENNSWNAAPEIPRAAIWYTEMIEKDFNHPSIFAWSVGNEMRGFREATKEYVRFMYDYIKTDLDPTRLITEVSMSAQDSATDSAGYTDFISINAYGSLRSKALAVRKNFPDKPVYFAEYGNTQTSDNPDNSAINPQSLLNQVSDLDYVMGASIWTLNDYRSNFYVNTPANQIRAWGVTSVWGDIKQGFDPLRRASSPVESLTLSVTGDGVTAGTPVIPLVTMKVRDGATSLPAYTLRGATLKWEALDMDGMVAGGYVEALDDLPPDGGMRAVSGALLTPEGGLSAIRATVIDSLGYEIAETVEYLAPPLASPEIVDVITTATGARVVFDHVPHATSYTVRALNASGTAVATATARLNGYADLSGLVSGNQYTFTVTAVNAFGSSAAGEMAATTNASVSLLPPAIRHTEPIQGGFWVGYSVGAFGESNDIEYGTTSGQYTESLTGVKIAGGFKVDGLAEDTTYYYRLRRYNAAGTASAWSQEVSVTTETGLQARDIPAVKGAVPGESSASITLEPSAKATGYIVKYGTAPDALDSMYYVHRAWISQITVPGLTPNTTYYFAVASLNGGISSEYSQVVSATPGDAGGEGFVLAGMEASVLQFLPGEDSASLRLSAFSTHDEPRDIRIEVKNLPEGVTVSGSDIFTVEKNTTSSHSISLVLPEDIEKRTYQGDIAVYDGDTLLLEKTVDLQVINHELLYYNEFDNASDLNDFTISGSGTRGIENGRLWARPNSKTASLLMTTGETEWADYVVGTDMQMEPLTEGDNGISSGIVFRYVNATNYHLVRFNLSASSVLTLQFYSFKDGAAAVNIGDCDVEGEFGDARNLKVVVQGMTATAYVNGEEMITVELEHEAGGIGFRPYGCKSYFDNLMAYSILPDIEVDKAPLAALIEEHSDKAEKDHTEASWADFVVAYEQAQCVHADFNAMNRHVAAAVEQLGTAAGNLVHMTDKSGLVALIVTAEGYDEDDYTEASYNALQDAIASAQAVVDDDEVTQQDVADAIAGLQAAIDALVEKPVDPEPVDKSALQALYNEYKDAQQGDYTGESWSVLQGALADAKNVLDDDDATAGDVAEAIEALQAAIDGLETGTPDPEPADKAALQALYDTHKDKQQGNYTGESWSALQTALANAKAVLDNAAATQGEVDAARTALQMAVDGLKVTQTPSTSKPGGSSGGSSSDGSSQGSKKYRVTKGSGAAYTGSGSVVFEIDGELSKLKAVRLGGKELARGVDYTAESGSVIITLLPALLESLESGSYSIEFVFEDGSGSATLTVRLDSTGSASASSGSGTGGEAAKTGDAANGMLYLILGLGAVAALAGTVLVRRKRAGR